ncbi:MAG: flagellar export chaperone FliS [Desulforegulaceae bacterium]|nr:flagellar export chaperone FliS [Desulforegulaceae bacterium]
MVYQNRASAYRKTEVSTVTDPNKLIQMLYDGALRFLEKARIGTERKDPKLRGENLGKALNIITELNSCLDIEKGGETAQYLRDLYLYMLSELPKANLTHDTEIIVRSMNYMKELKKLWEERVMGINKDVSSEKKEAAPQKLKERKSFSVAI